MEAPLKLLLIEDLEDDALLVIRSLRHGGLQLAYERIQTAEEMRVALTLADWDIIIADYKLPTFSAPVALSLLQASGRDIPFIVVSGTIGERAAVAMMQAGAGDYVMKDNLERLPEAVRREIREAESRAERKRAELALERERQQATRALERANRELETIVAQRTAELRESNMQLEATNCELARALRTKDEFLANMSHELRTPLNAILGRAELLQEPLYGTLSENQKKTVAIIERSGRHLLALISDILDLSKIASGKLVLKPEPTTISALCDNSLLFVSEQASQRQISLTCSLADDLRGCTILADDLRIRQALINLLANAVKFTPAGGSVHLEVELAVSPDADAPGPQLRFHVVDTGIGIAEADLGQLFQPFVQIDNSLTRHQSGTGLGLALVRRIAELHKGRVSVASRLGAGSRFTLEIPYTPVARADAGPPPASWCAPVTEPQAATGKLILLAEDDESNHAVLIDYLEWRGFRMLLARTGVEALMLARAHRPDLILMDVRMPELDGFATIEQIRVDAGLAHIPIIALTAFAMPSDEVRCRSAGANSYMTKPVRLSELLALIRRLLALDPARAGPAA